MNIGKPVRDSLSNLVGYSVCVSAHDSLRELISYSIWDLVNPLVYDSVRKVCILVRSLRW
jgi:hypothetical protein